MTAHDKQNGDAEIRTLVQRQLFLVDWMIEEEPAKVHTWPRFPDLTAQESYHLFVIMERWGWVVGSQVNAKEIRCTITSEGRNALSLLKSGRPPAEVAEQCFTDQDREALVPLVERTQQFPNAPTLVKRVRTATQRLWSTINNSKLGPASTLCYGLAAAVAGVQYATPGSLSMKWGLLLIALGAVIVAGRLAVAIRPFASARAAFRWLPFGVWAVVVAPLWLFIPEHQGFAYSTYYWLALLALATLSGIFKP